MMNKRRLFLILILVFAGILRLYKLDSYPPGLYSDEASQGYNAYSLIKTGADEFGNPWPITIKSFGDYKPPMSTWLDIPSVWALGLNNFAVRMPSALAGIATIFIVYEIVKEVFEEKLKKGSYFKALSFLAAFLYSISPWSLLFSRSNMLVGIEVAFTSAGFLFFLKGVKKNSYLLISSLFFSAAIYSYYGARITIFSLLMLLAILFRKELLSAKKYVIIGVVFGLIFLAPLIYSIVKDPLTLTGRAKSISIFYDQDVRLKLWQAHTLDGPAYPVLLSRFFNNKPYLYFTDIVMRYFQHFSFNFLALNGDRQIPFDLHGVGVVYIQEIFFFLVGIYFLIKHRTKKTIALMAYLAVSPIASSFTFVTPAANRSFNMSIAWSIITAVGIIYLINRIISIRFRKVAILFVSLSYLVTFSIFIYSFVYLIPYKFPSQWHYGRKELVEKVSGIEQNYSKVIISDSSGPAYIWFLFYEKYNPMEYKKSLDISSQPNEYGFLDVKSFGRYNFVKPFDWNSIRKSTKELYISYEDNIPDYWIGLADGKKVKTHIIDKVLYPDGKIAFKIVDLEPYGKN